MTTFKYYLVVLCRTHFSTGKHTESWFHVPPLTTVGHDSDPKRMNKEKRNRADHTFRLYHISVYLFWVLFAASAYAHRRFYSVLRVLFQVNRSAISPCACAVSAGSCSRIHTHLHCLLSQPLGKQNGASCFIIITICLGSCSGLLSLGSRDSIFSRSGGLGTAVVGETSRRVHLSRFLKGPLCHTSTLFSSLDLFMNMSIMVLSHFAARQ